MDKSNSKKAILNIVTNLISIFVVGIFGIFVPRIVIINYGSSTNGLMNSINQFVTYLSLFEAGIGGAALQALYKPVSQKKYEDINPILSALNKSYKKISLLYLIGLILLSLIYPLFVLNDETGLNYILVALCVFFSGFGNVVLFFAQGKFRIFIESLGKNYILNVLSTIIQILVSTTKIVLFLSGFNILYVIVSAFVFNLVQAIFIMLYIRNKYPSIDLRVIPNKESLKKNKFVFVHQITWLVFQNIDIVVLTIFCDLKVVSVYSIYKLIITMISSLIEVPFSSMNFIFGYKYNNNLDDYKKTISCFETYYSAFSSSLLAVVLLLFTPFLSLYTRNVTDINYLDSYLPFLFVISELLIFVRKPHASTITYAGDFKETMWQAIVEVTLNIILTIVGVILLGIYGALISTIVSLLFRLFVLIYYSSKKVLKKKTIKSFVVILVNLIICIGYYFALKTMNNCVSYTDFILKGITFLPISCVLFFTINSILFPNDFDYLKAHIINLFVRRKQATKQ